ncbi:toll/interleukin-1 receptor domain-containing protein [Streptomyces collinus]|uniref:toll/interleukin-1 receptor domain-containing protein n=1 Tax=Streptomyces collinus TaxID=42684 RepID=UPI0036A80BF7
MTVPLSVVRSTVYQYVKNLSDFLEDAFEEIDKARGAIKRIRLIRQARQAVREESDRLASEESRRATLRILQLTDDAQRSKATRSECYQRLRIVRNPSDGGDEFRWPPSELISRLQKVIDLSFQEGAMPFSCDDDKMNPEIRVWSRLATDMRQFHDSNPVDTKSDRWDFFIAYSSTDKNVATRIHSDLSKIGRAFLDTRCVKPGDQWGKVIHSAQGNSRSTVLLITANTPTSWYAESECIRAIQLARSEGHIVVPVLYGTNARLPYGLEQIQAATIEDWQDLSTLPELVKHIVEGP